MGYITRVWPRFLTAIATRIGVHGLASSGIAREIGAGIGFGKVSFGSAVMVFF